MVDMVAASDLGDRERFAEGDFVLLGFVEFCLEAEFKSVLFEFEASNYVEP